MAQNSSSSTSFDKYEGSSGTGGTSFSSSLSPSSASYTGRRNYYAGGLSLMELNPICITAADLAYRSGYTASASQIAYIPYNGTARPWTTSISIDGYKSAGSAFSSESYFWSDPRFGKHQWGNARLPAQSTYSIELVGSRWVIYYDNIDVDPAYYGTSPSCLNIPAQARTMFILLLGAGGGGGTSATRSVGSYKYTFGGGGGGGGACALVALKLTSSTIQSNGFKISVGSAGGNCTAGGDTVLSLGDGTTLLTVGGGGGGCTSGGGTYDGCGAVGKGGTVTQSSYFSTYCTMIMSSAGGDGGSGAMSGGPGINPTKGYSGGGCSGVSVDLVTNSVTMSASSTSASNDVWTFAAMSGGTGLSSMSGGGGASLLGAGAGANLDEAGLGGGAAYGKDAYDGVAFLWWPSLDNTYDSADCVDLRTPSVSWSYSSGSFSVTASVSYLSGLYSGAALVVQAKWSDGTMEARRFTQTGNDISVDVSTGWSDPLESGTYISAWTTTGTCLSKVCCVQLVSSTTTS